MKFPRFWSNLALLSGVAVIVAPVAFSEPINPYVLTAAKIATALGYTPANGSLYCALTGCTLSGALTVQATIASNSSNSGIVRIGAAGASTGILLQNGGTNTLSLSRGDNSSPAIISVGSITTPSVASASRSFINLNTTDGDIDLFNNAGTSFGLLRFGGTTSSFPAWKRSTTTLAARLADDSADAPVSASAYTASGSAGVSCGAGGLNPISAVVTNGIVTHC